MNSILLQLETAGIVPVVTINNPESAAPLGKALLDGGLPVAEITNRTEATSKSILNFRKSKPEMLVGAGTILSIEQVKTMVDSGAQFIVAPGFNPKVVEYCLANDILIIPGVNNPSQIERALEYDLDVVKFFPAEASGGLAFLKAVAAPYQGIRFMPTGGIHQNNIESYLSFNRVIACGGSWMVEKTLIETGAFDKITELTRQAVALTKQMSRFQKINKA